MSLSFRFASNSSGLFAAVLAALMIVTGFSGPSYGATAEEIDANVDAALDRFHEKIDGAEEFSQSAKGLLVMANVKKAAVIVGGEYGQGALRIDGKTVDYYSTGSGSVGLQIGGQAKDFIIAFMTDDALSKFRDSKGWEAGVDGNIALITIGAGGRLDTRTAKEPIVGFVFDVKGLMVDVSLKGAKFNKLDKTE